MHHHHYLIWGDMRKILVVPVLAVALTSGLTGCARKANGTIDAPIVQKNEDNTPAQIIDMPDGWRNIATKCVTAQPGKRVYQQRGTYSVPVVVDDPSCK
jgi:hypothetical protein